MTSALRQDDWEYRARCKDGGANWFPVGRSKVRRPQVDLAVRLCRTECPVRQQCAQLALDARKTCGIWGGQDLGDTGCTEQRQWQREALQAVLDGKA